MTRAKSGRSPIYRFSSHPDDVAPIEATVGDFARPCLADDGLLSAKDVAEYCAGWLVEACDPSSNHWFSVKISAASAARELNNDPAWRVVDRARRPFRYEPIDA